MQRGVVRRNPPDGHKHTKLRSQATDSRDPSVMVQPTVEISDGEDVDILGMQGQFYQVTACFP